MAGKSEAFKTALNARVRLLMSSGGPLVLVKTKPVSFQALPATSRSLSCWNPVLA